MSWYNTPIQPMDPVVVSGQPKPPIRYVRDNFAGSGQHSYVKPPAQDQAQWQSLINVQPITQGILNQRWGYTQFAGLSTTPNRLYNFQSDSLGTRAIIAAGSKSVSAFNENGSAYIGSVFVPTTFGSTIRSLTSRNYQYFCDGNNALDPVTHRTGDSLKWGGGLGASIPVTVSINANGLSMAGSAAAAISTITESGPTCTVTLAVTTPFDSVGPGDTIIIAGVPVSGYNGTFIILSVAFISGHPVYTYSNGTTGLAASSGGTAAATTAQVTTTTPGAFTPGQIATISGAGVSGYNGAWVITGVLGTTIYVRLNVTGLAASGNGTISSTFGGVSNIGILATDVTQNLSSGGTTGGIAGPNTGITAVDIAYPTPQPWSNPPGVFTNSLTTAASISFSNSVTVTVNPAPPFNYIYTWSGNQNPYSDYIKATNFFNSVSGSVVNGIQVAITYRVTYSGVTPPYIVSSTGGAVQIVKNGVLSGIQRGFSPVADGATHTLTLGNATDLWGTSFSPADLVQTNFGIELQSNASFTSNTLAQGTFTAHYTIQILYVTITVHMGGGGGTSSSSGGGVGINAGVPGGAINLTIGRVYYLVANTATVGHFSDLTVASANSGASTNTEYKLLLATFNDLQVDTKYVLATADGGDPSILYQAQVLVPGLTVSSWTIDGANHVTFTGVYTGSQFPVGKSVVVGGLSTGSFLNNATLVVTASTPTNFTANFTHATTSATETGVVGNLSYSIPNSVALVVDNTPDPTLVLNQPLLFTDQAGNTTGVALNTPPPAGSLIIKHQGRLWMAGVLSATHSIFFSKSIAELTLPNGFIAGKYEEAWPGSNYFDVSDGAESVSALLSDGQSLYIGTQRHIRRLLGNSPTNFQQPQIVHPEVGVINQEVWQIVFTQGAPSGSCWMTPDFRIMQSDFNTYVDIGTPIQDILNALQPTAQTLAHASFVADGEYEFYVLAVPYKQPTYCDTHLVYDLRSRQWFVWQPASGSLATLYNVAQSGAPQWLFIDGAGAAINIYNPTSTSDNGTLIPVTATTTWLHLGEPTRRKMLNEVQVYGNTGMTMTINGANNLAEFSSPRAVIYNRPLKQSPFGTWNQYLTNAITRHRYYQFTFNSSNGIVPLLGSYSIAAIPMDDL